MCRYVAYLGQPLRLSDMIYKPSNSLVHQATEAMESPTRINADGFGVGWYDPAIDPEPAVFKDISPAWNNANLRSLADKVASPCILAHVRAASRNDPIGRANCHPFDYGPLLWMHNGDVPGRARLHRRVVSRADDGLVARIHGSTDTELAFTLFLSHLGARVDRDPGVDELAAAMRRTIAQIAAWQREDGDERFLALNFCVANGRGLVASRFARGELEAPSLHYSTGHRFVCEDGECRLEPADAWSGCTIVSSERLSQDAPWETVGPDRLLVVREDRSVSVEPLDAS